MRVSDITRINLIDTTIEKLHAELKALYDERSTLTLSQSAASNQAQALNLDIEAIDLSIDEPTGLNLRMF